MTNFRPCRNGDVPALAELWNAALPDDGVARPLDAHEFDALVMGRLFFEADGLIVAERAGRVVGFAHAGFGPEHPEGPSHRLDRSLGTIAMLAVAPDVEDSEVDHGLILEAERYLRRRGAEVAYAGGQYPLNPFYWGLYGGSECSGILDGHRRFVQAVEGVGYQPSATTIRLQVALTRQSEARDPKSLLVRRQTRLDVVEDAVLERWWDALAIGASHPVAFTLLDRGERPIARAVTWEMAGFDRLDGRVRLGLIGLEVEPDRRGQGLGRHLVGEILRFARGQMAEVLVVQTDATNAPALALYESLGFERVGSSTLYRLPGPPGDRPPDGA